MKRLRALRNKHQTPLLFALLGGLLVLIMWLPSHLSTRDDMSLRDFNQRLTHGQIKLAAVNDSKFTIAVDTTDGGSYLVNFPASAEYAGRLTDELLAKNVNVVTAHASFWDNWGWAITLSSWIIYAVMIGLVLWTNGPERNANSEMRKFILSGVPETRLDDVAGLDDARDELRQIVDYMKDPERYDLAGVKPIRGILLTGKPGTGKTLLAMAVAGEAGVPFVSCSGADFIGALLVDGKNRVEAVFKYLNRVNGPCLIFIDEIDVIALRRANSSASNSHRPTLNTLLTKLDGFRKLHPGVVVIAATNVDPEELDSALLRPGRFTRVMETKLPDPEARRAILLANVGLLTHLAERGLKLELLVDQTNGMTGADLANLANTAGLLAMREGTAEREVPVQWQHFEAALEKVRTEKKFPAGFYS